MPLEPPPTVPQTFLNAVALLAWSGDALLNTATGAVSRPFVNAGAWDLGASGDKIAEATYRLLVAAGPHGANANGSFTSGGVAYWLEVENTREGTWAQPVAA